MKNFLNVREVAEALSISRSTLYLLRKTPTFPRPHMLAGIKYRASDIERYARDRRIESPG